MMNTLKEFFCLNKKFLVYNMVSRNLKVKYRRSALGFLWTLAMPLSQALVYYFVFKYIFKSRTDYYVAYVLMGILPWGFVAQTLTEASESLIFNSGILTKIPTPIQIFPLVTNVTNMVTLLLGLPVVILFAGITGAPMGLSLVLIPLLLFFLFVISYSLTLFLSVQSVYYRDLKPALAMIVQLLFYATPVIYDLSMLPESFHWILWVNPFGSAFICLHQILPGGQWPDLTMLLVTLVWTLGSMLFSIFTMKHHSRFIVERL